MMAMTGIDDVAATLLPIILVLTLGIAAAVLSRMTRVSPIVGFLILGIIIGRVEPGLLATDSVVRLMAELGVVFLLFDIGLHFSISHVREQAGDIFGFGPVQVAGATVALAGVAWLLGLTPTAALLIGATLSLSSTAVVANIIAERHQRSCPVGLTATAILVFQDVVAIFLLIMATALQSGGALPALGAALIKAVLAFGCVLLAARFVVRPLFSIITRHGGEEVFTGVALAIAMTASWAASQAGLSMTLGAFLGGMVVAESPFRAIVRSEISPFRGLLLGFFFISVGASINLAALGSGWSVILLLAVGMVSVKIVTNAAASPGLPLVGPGFRSIGLPACSRVGICIRRPGPACYRRARRRDRRFAADCRSGAHAGDHSVPVELGPTAGRLSSPSKPPDRLSGIESYRPDAARSDHRHG